MYGVISILLLASFLTLSDCGRILLLPFPMHSHMAELASIAEGLQENGHEIYMLISPTLPDFEEQKKSYAKRKITILTHEVRDPDFYMTMDEADTTDYILSAIKMTFMEDTRTSVDPIFPVLSICTNPLGDTKLFQQLQDLKFDLAIIDAFFNTRCLYVLLYRLGIPYVSAGLQYEPWLQRNPALPSFVPFPLGTTYTEKMNFWQRLYNLYTLIDWSAFPGVAFLDDELVKKYAPDKPFVTLDYLAGRSLLWLMDTDVTLDYPRPLMPNMVEIGGMTTRPAKPLSSELEKIMQSPEAGVIVVSFGSFGASLPKFIQDKLFDAFKKIDQQVVWSYPSDPPQDIPSNVKLMCWLPQQDLLGHPKTVLFITHGGTNGQFEALYHGVPMITFPMFGDQKYNAVRSQYKGFGFAMDLLEFKPDELVQNIKKILADPNYKENVKTAGEIYRSRPQSPKERAAYWIEHVMKYGGDHLHSYALDMPWYEYLMLDILVCLVLISMTACVSSVCICRFVVRKCRHTSKK